MIASLQRLEERLQQGPCVEAARTGQIVALGDLDRYPAKWPDYVTLAESLGIPAVAAIPMGTDREPIGSLGLYDRYGRVWSEEEMASAKVLADLAANYILVASGLEELRATTEQLQQALNSRIVIEQANGIISADRGISIQEAFKDLRKYANDHRASLRTTADAVVHLGLRPR